MSTMFKRITAGAVTVAATTGLLTVGAAPAFADTVTVEYNCVVPNILVQRTFDITITVPATATRGRPVAVTATVVTRFPVSSPTPAGTLKGKHTITLGGASTGSLTVDPMSNPPLQPGQPKMMTGSTQITFNTAGTITFRPGYTAPPLSTGEACQPRNTASVPVAATTRVS